MRLSHGGKATKDCWLYQPDRSTVMGSRMTIVEIANKTNGRPIKFTPERIEQIKNLVERGKSREDIAEIINVTVGSLQVTCSRHGISLKRPKLNNGVGHAPRSRSDMPAQDRRAQLALRLRYRGIDRIVELPLSEEVLGRLVIEAHFRNLSISDLTAKLIIAGLDPGSPST